MCTFLNKTLNADDNIYVLLPSTSYTYDDVQQTAYSNANYVGLKFL